MSEFIERLARAMYDEANPDDDYDKFVANNPNPKLYVRMVRAVLSAMEQPSQKMIEAGNALDDEGSPNDGDFGNVATAAEHWRAMITAELKDDSD